MSCFESSTFRRNHNLFDQNILIESCNKLGWRVHQSGRRLQVYQSSDGVPDLQQPDLTLIGNHALFNRMQSQGPRLFSTLQRKYNAINVEYAERAIIQEFEARNFKQEEDPSFVPKSDAVRRFFMVAQTTLFDEDERETRIEFTIFKDGKVISDSNYIPYDVHAWADAAMDGLDRIFGTQRREGIEIKRKRIPRKYKAKAYCSPKQKLKSAKQELDFA